ncbi:MAG: UvrD-helicase domain-containing protein, partial [Duodenibacillus sp.]|nr:UvrD-helicase domain-containing protein [Duodenibacillus sp.]
MNELTQGLNPQQRQAVELPAEHALVLAGAGSGKTRVLTTRIAWIIAQAMARPWQILAVTFTNKAAREMKARLDALVPGATNSLWAGTFHAIAHRMLRLHCDEARLPSNFQIIDSSDQLAMIKRIMKEGGIDTEQVEPKKFQAAINRAKEQGLRASHFAADAEDSRHIGVYQAYEARCQREGLVDFAELLLRCVELLEHSPELRAHYAERFRFLLIDEFQDTNALQYRWVKALAPRGQGGAVFCVGDDDQSIYAFRGARVGNMADFIRDYGVQHVVRLEQNYRSSSHILEAANAVIANNADRMGKNLWTDAGKGELIGLYSAEDDREEAHSIVQDIL